MTVEWLRRRAAISMLAVLASPSLAADTDSADTHMLQSPGLRVDRGDVDSGLGPNSADALPAIPVAKKGDRTPFDIYRYAGKAGSSFGDTSLPMPFADWVRFNVDRKPELMRDVRAYIASRYAFSGEAIDRKSVV